MNFSTNPKLLTVVLDPDPRQTARQQLIPATLNYLAGLYQAFPSATNYWMSCLRATWQPILPEIEDDNERFAVLVAQVWAVIERCVEAGGKLAVYLPSEADSSIGLSVNLGFVSYDTRSWDNADAIAQLAIEHNNKLTIKDLYYAAEAELACAADLMNAIYASSDEPSFTQRLDRMFDVLATGNDEQ